MSKTTTTSEGQSTGEPASGSVASACYAVMSVMAGDRIQYLHAEPGDANDGRDDLAVGRSPDSVCLLAALCDLIDACELPGDHCEIEQALRQAKIAIDDAIGKVACHADVLPELANKSA